MPATRRRRILRWTAITIAAPVVLLASYLVAWLTVSKAAHKEFISRPVAAEITPVFKPVRVYCCTDLPGAKMLTSLWWQVNPDRWSDATRFASQPEMSRALYFAPHTRNYRSRLGLPLR